MRRAIFACQSERECLRSYGRVAPSGVRQRAGSLSRRKDEAMTVRWVASALAKI